MNQMGDKLGTYRDKSNQFVTSKFKIELVNAESGEKVDGVKTETDNVQFMWFMMPRDVVLPKGKYVLGVFALWNEQAHQF